ncbi:MAG: S8 family serine peptidase [Myxococcales bacterium]|nr:S8 family serine peptidase [Myxococcales bacterium]
MTHPMVKAKGVTRDALLKRQGRQVVSVRLKGLSGAELAPLGKKGVAKVKAEQESFLSRCMRMKGVRYVGRTQHVLNAVFLEVDVDMVKDLLEDTAVERVTPVGDYKLDLLETVPYIGGTAVHNLGIDGTGVRVAVIDSGIDYYHASLGGSGDPADHAADDPSVVEPGSFPTAKVVGGFDFVGSGWPNTALAPDPDPLDDGAGGGHGTHVADIIGGVNGVAPGVELYAFKACSSVSSSCSGVALIQAMDRAVDVDGDGDTSDAVDIINMSLGSNYGQPFDDDLAQAVENATALARALEQEILRLDPDAGSPLLAELMQATFPAQVDRLDRLLELWATPPRPELLERPDGPLSAIRSAIAERHRPAEQNLAELDATLQALAHSLPPLSPDLMEPEPSVDLTAPSHSVTHHPAAPAPRPRPRRGLLLWVLAAGALALGGGVYMARSGSTIPQGRLRIVTEPHGADVQIDGEAMGTTPVTVPGLRGDVEHKVVIRLEGYATVERKVRFGGGETRSLTLDLVPAGSEEPPSADEGDEVDFKDNPY